MQAKAKTLYLQPDVHAMLTRGRERSASAALTTKLRRYNEIVAKSKPPLTAGEWELLRIVLKHYATDRIEYLRGIAAVVKAWTPSEGQARPAGVDPQSFAFRLEQMPIAQLIAAIELIEAEEGA